MKKIRINELARELEVKAHEILERLPELGVTEKKTHSSSIDEDVAIRLRVLYGVTAPVAEAPAPAPAQAPEPAPEMVERGRKPAVETVPEAPVALKERQEPRVAAEEARPAAPVRPPLATGRPVHPPLGTPGQAPPAVVFTPGRPRQRLGCVVAETRPNSLRPAPAISVDTGRNTAAGGPHLTECSAAGGIASAPANR